MSGTGDTVADQAHMEPVSASALVPCCGSQTWLTLEPLRVLYLTLYN